MHGYLKLTGHGSSQHVDSYVAALSSELRAIRAGRVFVRGATVSLDVDMLRLAFTWLHPLKGVSSAQFHVAREADALRVDYTFSLLAQLWLYVPFAMVVMAKALTYPPSLMNLAGPPAVIAIVIALNIAISHIQIRRVLARVGAAIK